MIKFIYSLFGKCYHEWTPWSDPYKVSMISIVYDTGKETPCQVTRQSRSCKKCNHTDYRTVSDIRHF